MTLPEKFLEKYGELEGEELLTKLYEAEQASVKYKKENKSTEKTSAERIAELEKKLEDFEKGSQKSELDNFLNGKDLSEDEKKSFDEMVKKGYEKEHALKLATEESDRAGKSQEEISKNVLDGEDDIDGNSKKITMGALSELSQGEYNKTMEQVDAGEIEIVGE